MSELSPDEPSIAAAVAHPNSRKPAAHAAHGTQTNLLRRDWIARARAVRIEDEIARRGVKLKGRAPERYGPCPKCGGTDRFAINSSKQIWNCRGCQRGGDVISLVQARRGNGDRRPGIVKGRPTSGLAASVACRMALPILRDRYRQDNRSPRASSSSGTHLQPP
jgi:CHC2-type zinc finger protein